MKRPFFLFLLSFILIVSAYCQTTTKVIDYTQFTTANCNAFSNGTTIGLPIQGYTHYPSYGQPKSVNVTISGTSTRVIELDNKYVTQNGITSPYGTLYTIAYPFKTGNKYKVTVNAAAIATDGVSYPSLYISIDNTSYNFSDVCTGPAQFNQTGTPFTTNNTFKDYSVDNFVPPANFAGGQIAIESQPNGNSSSSQIYIKKITIAETVTACQPSFNLPSSVSVTCGSVTPQTFTVTNVNNCTGVTSYVWNLTSGSNGWKYNGANAPQSITTTGNSIVLTPICGATLENVSAVVTVAGVNYATNTSIVNITTPAVSIMGGNISNGPVNYSITSLPCGASVVWSVSPSGIVSPPSCTNCSSTSLSRTTNGTVTLTAVVTSCGVSQTITKQISVCTPYNLATNLTATPGASYGYYLHFNPVIVGGNPYISYYLDYNDLTTNTYGTTNMGYSPNNDYSNFFYYLPNNHSFRYRVAPASICGSGAGDYSAWSSPIIPPASCANGPISTTLMQSLGCGGSGGCTYTNLSWPAIVGASQYKVNYSIQNVSTGIVGASGIITTSTPNVTVNFPALTGTGWTITYQVAANCSGTFGNYSGYSNRFFIQ